MQIITNNNDIKDYTDYVHDAQGNIMAIYNRSESEPVCSESGAIGSESEALESESNPFTLVAE